MKQHKAIFIALIIVCMTALAAVLVSRKDLCEFRIRTNTTEVAAFMACDPQK
ncbi:Hok/Gef family protein [Erwinia aphidicola]|uniref:Hok/Gef family protein n=1 Tax=Erwinia TaxID=551 RepID=UPI00105FDAE1|nr:Hok/Gef family protein [Erwinia aphidicola]MCP2229889.1 protein HokC/D [Erwinia aphidicola]